MRLANQIQVDKGKEFGLDLTGADASEADNIIWLMGQKKLLEAAQERIDSQEMQNGCSVHYSSWGEERDGTVQNVLREKGLVTVRWQKPVGESKRMVSVVRAQYLTVLHPPE